MSIPTLTTPRLLLRGFTSDDAPAFFAIRSDPVVARYLAGKRPETVEDTYRFFEKNGAHWAEHGYGLFAVVEQATGALIGQCGLWTLANSDDTEVAYAFAQSAWGKGYATEAARAAIHDGFTRVGLSQIYALAVPENSASRHVMEKLGMDFEGLVDRYYNAILACYRLKKMDSA